MRKFLFALLLIVLVNTVLVWAQTAATETTGSADVAKLEELRRGGIEALYNLDYDKAQKDFREIVRLYPNSPAGPQLLAARLWIKTLYETRRLQASLYSSEGFYSSGDDKVDPKIINEFRNLSRDAKRLAEAQVRKDPNDVDALDWLAVIEGLKASFEEAVERRHFAALKDGNDAVDHHRDVLKLDPTRVDANLTIGLYEYAVASLPLPVRLVAGVAGFRGSKKKGLALIERVTKEGRWSSQDAKTLLIVLYTREKRYADAAVLARELSVKYPRNYLFRLEAADALVSQAEIERGKNNIEAANKAEREAFAAFDDLLRDRSVRDTISHSLDLVHFKYGEALLTAGEGDRAAREFLNTTKVERAEASLVTMAHLYAARAFDLAGKREDALTHYREVLTRPDIYAAHEEAKKGLRQPFKNELASTGM